jgi:uncharacterized membrane protein (DUF4010 family)
LYFQHQLHDITQRLTHNAILAILQFGVLSLVILPILPNQSYGPYLALNPHHIWWMVVLVSGVSLAGYTALRLIGTHHGATLLGLFGGLVSSTATTVIFSRHARQNASLVPIARIIVLLASMVTIVRLNFVAALLAPSLWLPLAKVLNCGLLVGILLALWLRYQQRQANGKNLPMPNITNPTELKTAITFGAMYALILVLSAWLKDIAGSQGLYFLALVSGLTDVDAITLSALHMLNANSITQVQAVTTITLALLSNMAFKCGLIIALGGRELTRSTLPGMLAIAAGVGGGLMFIF